LNETNSLKPIMLLRKATTAVTRLLELPPSATKGSLGFTLATVTQAEYVSTLFKLTNAYLYSMAFGNPEQTPMVE
jgi:hypothetical protein